MAIRKRNNFSDQIRRRAYSANPAGKKMTLLVLKVSALAGVLIFGLIVLIRFNASHQLNNQTSRLRNPGTRQPNQQPQPPIPTLNIPALKAPLPEPDEPPLILKHFIPPNEPVPTAEQAPHAIGTSGDVCVPPPHGEMVRGTLRSDSILTLISVPKTPTLGENSGGEMAERHLMFGWSQMKRVDFLIMSSNCQVLRLAAEYGLPTVYLSSGSDTEDLTYRHILKVVRTLARSPYVGFTNGDIAYDDTLVQTLQAAEDWPGRNGMPMSFIGRRANADIPPAFYGEPDEPITVERWNKILTHMQQTSEMFIDAAQDYFIFSRDLPLNLDALVPFLLGGIAFDNYIATKFWELHAAGVACSVDATQTINALHMNHGQKNELKLSHTNLASKFNAMLVRELVTHDRKLKKKNRRQKVGIHHGYTSHTQMQSVVGTANRPVDFMTREKARVGIFGSMSATTTGTLDVKKEPPANVGLLYDVETKSENDEDGTEVEKSPGTSMDGRAWIAQRKANEN